MNEVDPYAAPQSDPMVPSLPGGRLDDVDFKKLRKDYYRSSNVNVIAFLLALGAVAWLIVSLAPDSEAGALVFVNVGISVFSGVTAFGLFRRASWGRVLGIIACVVSLISIPFGTIIGVAGLFAFFGSPHLFGPERVMHKELKAEFKRQKALRKSARRGGGS